MDTASPNVIDLALATEVEHCECPQGYAGISCEVRLLFFPSYCIPFVLSSGEKSTLRLYNDPHLDFNFRNIMFGSDFRDLWIYWKSQCLKSGVPLPRGSWDPWKSPDLSLPSCCSQLESCTAHAIFCISQQD